MYGKFTVPTFGWCLWFMSLYILYMDPMCYLPVQRVPGNYHRKNQKGTKRRQQPKTPQTEVVGVLSCAMHRSSFKFSGEIPGFNEKGTGITHKSLGSLKSFKEKRKEKTSTVFEFNTKIHPISESWISPAWSTNPPQTYPTRTSGLIG